MQQSNALPLYDALNHPLDLAPRSAAKAQQHTNRPASKGTARAAWPFSAGTMAAHGKPALAASPLHFVS